VAHFGQKRNDRPWRPISTAPDDKEVEVQVNDRFGFYCLTFPVRRTGSGWVNAKTNSTLEVQPTHWRDRKPNR
jgi:hypothetical protein